MEVVLRDHRPKDFSLLGNVTEHQQSLAGIDIDGSYRKLRYLKQVMAQVLEPVVLGLLVHEHLYGIQH